MVQKIFLLCLLPFQLYAQSLIKDRSGRPDVDLLASQNILGTYKGPYNGRIGAAYFSSPNPQKILRGLSSFELLVGFKFKEVWLDTFFSSSSGEFATVASNSNNLGSEQSEGHFRRDKKEKFKLIQTGMGLTLESALIRRFLKSDKFYEYSTAFVTYSIFQDEMRTQEKYAGVGLRADYSLNYQLTSVTNMAFRLSYRFSPVARPPSQKLSKEPRGERSLMLSWPSVGVETTYFF